MCFSKPDKPKAAAPTYAPPAPEEVAEAPKSVKKSKKNKTSKRDINSLTINRPTSNIQSTGTGLSI